MSEDTWFQGVVAPLVSEETATPNEIVLMQSMLAAEQYPRSETLWTDDSGAYYIRLDSGGTLSWLTPTGSASSAPGTGIRPAAGLTVILDTSRYQATIAGTGYAVSDFLSHVVTADPSTGAILSSFWLNVTQNTKLASNPVSANITPISTVAANAAQESGGNLAAILTKLLGTVSMNLSQLLGVAIGPSNAIPIYDAYLAAVIGTWTSATTAGVSGVGTAISSSTAGYDGVMVSFVVTGTITAGHVTFEAYDGAAWLPVKGFPLESYNSFQGYTLVTGLNNGLQFDISGCTQFRVRLDTAIVGAGSLKITMNVSSAPIVPGLTVGLDPLQPLPVTTTKVANIPTVQAAIYPANKPVGGIQNFANLLPALTFAGLLESITLKFKGSVQPGGFWVGIFTSSPTGTFGDSITVSAAIAAADSANLVGLYHLTSPVSVFGTHTVYNLDGIAKAIVGTSTSLYAVIVPDASTVALGSTSDLIVELGVIQG